MKNKYDSAAAFVPPVPPGRRQWREPETIDVVPIPATDIAPAMESTKNASRDSVSAVDRAKGFNTRMIIPMAMTVVLGLAGVIFWTLTLSILDVGQVAPWMLDRVLIFLAITGGMGFTVWTKANQVDHDHTHAGVERHRITTAKDIRTTEIVAEKEIRLAALSASLRLLEERDNDRSE